VAELRLTLAALEVGKLDVSSPMMQTVESLWMESVAEVAHETIPEPESFLGRLREAMAGWRARLEPPRVGR
jgi:alpha-glucuronidase